MFIFVPPSSSSPSIIVFLVFFAILYILIRALTKQQNPSDWLIRHYQGIEYTLKPVDAINEYLGIMQEIANVADKYPITTNKRDRNTRKLQKFWWLYIEILDGLYEYMTPGQRVKLDALLIKGKNLGLEDED